ncbi:MAG TPA: hemerythrin domain-containing protein [Actinomycetota bacterium]
MTTIETVQQEHEQFRPYLEEIRDVADSIGRASIKSLLGRMGEIHEFLAHRLIPHAVAEGRLMLPLVRELPGGAQTAAGMNQCHVQLGRLTDELEAAVKRARAKGMDVECENDLRRILYGLHTLLVGHFAQAEEVFTAAIEPESAPERAELFQNVERSAEEISDQYE